MAEQAWGRVALSDHLKSEDLREAGVALIAAIAGFIMLKMMGLPLVSLAGASMIAAAIFVGHMVTRVCALQEEQKRLEAEHEQQLRLADELMLTPDSIK